jgi:cytochrome c peroxidase
VSLGHDILCAKFVWPFAVVMSVVVAVMALLSTSVHAQPPSGITLSADERAMLHAHGPWPMQARRDASNQWSANALAVSFGRSLFFDVSLSPDRKFSCASCHLPDKFFTDGRARGIGRARLKRNTLTVVGLSNQRWFGWDGANDNLWAQSIWPILASDEMNATANDVRVAITASARLSCGFQQVFGNSPADMANADLLVAVGKALAAYQEGLSIGASAFDRFRTALFNADQKAIDGYPRQARRGLKLFVGYARCSLCHFGPAFSNGEFDSVGIKHFLAPGEVDQGRFAGIQQLRATPMNRLGRFNDNRVLAPGTASRHVAGHPRTFGQFKVPSLRNVALTAPYMHAGSHPSLKSVVEHYNDINVERLHADGERILRPLKLPPADVDALVVFLGTLNGALLDATRDDALDCP